MIKELDKDVILMDYENTQDLYISILESRCIICLKKTKCRCFLTNRNLCQKCGNENFNYIKIAKTRVIKEYYLNEKNDLVNMKSVVCGKPPMTLFLLSEVLKKAYEKHGGIVGFNELLEKKQKQADERFRKKYPNGWHR